MQQKDKDRRESFWKKPKKSKKKPKEKKSKKKPEPKLSFPSKKGSRKK